MFNLEKSIQIWKRQLRRSPAFEDGDIAELESHLRDEMERLKAEGLSEEEAFYKATKTFGEPDPIADEMYKTKTTKTVATPPWKESKWMPAMISNYLKVARRNLSQNKLYAGINISGLAIAIVCCLFIYLFIHNELNYDRFHEKEDRIYKVTRLMEGNDGFRKIGITSAPFADALKIDFPNTIEEVIRIMPSDGVVTIDNNNFTEDRFYIADANLFDVFSWPLIQGNPETVLSQPYTVAISEETALKYFGNEDAIGKTIRVNNDNEYEITGVFKKPPNAQSHIEFDLVASMETFKNAAFYSGWWWNNLHTYILLAPNVQPEQLESQLTSFINKYFGDNIAQNNRRIELALLPLSEVYFANDIQYDSQIAHGDKTIIYMFGIVALLIIIVACVNFVNMATARSVSRAKEIGIRKTLGAHRSNLMAQFLGESLLMSFSAGILSFLIVYYTTPLFEQLTGKNISISLFSPQILFFSFLFILITGLLSGIYPALFLSSFEPVKALKEKINFGVSQLFVRKGLIVFQFTVSSLLIIGTLIVNQQLNFISNKSLGFESNQLLNIDINLSVSERLETFQQSLEQIPGVEISSAMSGTPGGFYDNYLFRAGENWDQTHTLKTLFTDHNFSEVMDLNMLAGRDFSNEYASDSTNSVIINKTAADMFGWTPELAIGKRFQNQFLDSTARVVIGVVEDFHFQSLYQPIAPLVVAMNDDRREFLVKVESENINGTLTSIEEVWNEFSPFFPIEYHFIDQQFEQLYENDTRQRSVFAVFTFIAVLIACMGLFSLASFNAEKRRKEMGVRKILGADFSSILILFNKEMLMTVFISFIIAAPLTYFLAELWLQNYAYRISNSYQSLIIAGLVVLTLSLITISYQSIKIALSNPVNNLKND